MHITRYYPLHCGFFDLALIADCKFGDCSEVAVVPRTLFFKGRDDSIMADSSKLKAFFSICWVSWSFTISYASICSRNLASDS